MLKVAKELDGGPRRAINDNHLDSIVFHKLATYNIFIGEVVNPTCCDNSEL